MFSDFVLTQRDCFSCISQVLFSYYFNLILITLWESQGIAALSDGVLSLFSVRCISLSLASKAFENAIVSVDLA